MQREKSSACWHFANARFDERTLELGVAGQIVAIERKTLEVLRLLLRRAGEVVTHDELLDSIWPGRVVSESVLKKCVSRLREALGDDDHAVIKTVHGYGYRLLSAVEVRHPQPAVLLAAMASPPGASPVRRCAVLMLALAGAGVAAREARARELVDGIAAAVAAQAVFVARYDDELLVAFEQNPIAQAARAAITAQQLAARAGLGLYAGLHYGDAEFHSDGGRASVTGPAVGIAARLLWLTEGVPGRIYLAEEAARTLPPELRERASRFDVREFPGAGRIPVWTLEWQDQNLTAATAVATVQTTQRSSPAPTLLLNHSSTRLRIPGASAPVLVGRRADCALRILDPESKLSSSHLLFEYDSDKWFVRDVSRNGTWLHTDGAVEEARLPSARATLLPRQGRLSLGRAFVDDPERRFAVEFSVIDE